MELQIKVRLDNGTGQVWTYGYFEVDGSETNYTLRIGQAQGPSGGKDSMAWHNGMQFTTTGRDNASCARMYGGSEWWYKSCFDTLLTGRHSPRGVFRWNRNGPETYYPFAEMRLRPKNCKTIEICN